MRARPRTAASAALLTGAVLLGSGCVSPAVNDTGYEGKASATASGAVSAANAALLAFHAFEAGRLTGQVLEVTLQQSEDSLGSLGSTFDSVQPPNSATSDQARQQVDDLLSPAQDAVSALRIATRRGDEHQMASQAADLTKATKALEHYVSEHPK